MRDLLLITICFVIGFFGSKTLIAVGIPAPISFLLAILIGLAFSLAFSILAYEDSRNKFYSLFKKEDKKD